MTYAVKLLRVVRLSLAKPSQGSPHQPVRDQIRLLHHALKVEMLVELDQMMRKVVI